MTTLYFAQGIDDQFAAPTQADAKKIAQEGFGATGQPKQVMKVELNKDIGSRELLCALFNNEPDKFVGSKEVIYTAGPRKGKGGNSPEPEAEAEESEENLYDI